MVNVVAPSRDHPRNVTVLGSTGSIGENTVDLILRRPEIYRVQALTAHRNVTKLAEQARKLKPKFAAVADPQCYGELKTALSGSDIEVAAGTEALCQAAALPAEWVMAAIVGAAGLAPTLTAVRRGAVVALANKECLVCAGPLLMAAAAAHGATLLPVDSEHNAIFQVFDFDQKDKIRRIVLTASGGPFRTWTWAQMAKATLPEALAHPNWSMGAKISVDSATMMNKGLELIEAHYLFGMPENMIDILVHPQSVVHSLVEYCDGSVLAQLGTPDMRTPIAHALGWPERLETGAARLDLVQRGTLTFEAPDTTRFPALRIARHALQRGGAAPTILNAANEVAVARFLAGQVGFLDIAAIVERTLEQLPSLPLATFDDVLAADTEARRIAAGAAALTVAAE